MDILFFWFGILLCLSGGFGQSNIVPYQRCIIRLQAQAQAGGLSRLRVRLLGPSGRGRRGDITIHAGRTLRFEPDSAVPAES